MIPLHLTEDVAYLRFLIVELRQQTTEAFAIIEQRLAALEAARQTDWTSIRSGAVGADTDQERAEHG